MAKAVTLTYKSQGKQILTIQDAIDAKSFYDKQPDVNVGDADGMWLLISVHVFIVDIMDQVLLRDQIMLLPVKYRVVHNTTLPWRHK